MSICRCTVSLLIVVILSNCGVPPSEADAGLTRPDAGGSAVVVTDAAVGLDAGTISPTDAAVEVRDAGVVSLDAGFGYDDDAGTPWPKWVWGHWVWEGESTASSALTLLADYAAHDIPVGAIIVDSPWETQYNSLEWDLTRFPQPQTFIDAVHAQNTKLLLWIVPGINVDAQPMYDDLKDKKYFMQKLPLTGPAVISWWKGKGSLLDYFNPKTVSWWHSRLDLVLAMGIDGWKCDGLDFSVSLAPYSPGKPGFVNHAQYATAYYRDFFDYTRSKLGTERVITARPIDTYGYDLSLGIGQATFAPREVNWVGWVGDQDATFDGLQDALLNMYYSAQQGYLGFGSDIGGYRTDGSAPKSLGRTKELFIRWAQLGAFSPLMENGGGGEHRPWMFDDETTNIYRVFVKLHLSLAPYFNSEGLVAWSQNKSMVSFIDKNDFAYLLGRDIFVTPMLEGGTSRTVSFPAGSDWVYLFDKTKTYPGGSKANLTVPLSEYPVFLKAGSRVATELVPSA